MERVDKLIFGYRRIKVPAERLSRITARLLRRGIQTSLSSDGTFTVRERDIAQVKAALLDTEYEVSQTLGALGWYKRLRCKGAIFAALIFSAILMLLSENTVWDVRVEGNETLPDAAIVKTLEECGFSVGDSWLFTDRSEVETSVLNLSEDIAWININRRGSVAYVVVAEKAKGEPEEDASPSGYSNVVAAVDCVIEEITVYSGKAMVKSGDAVKKGDLLIAGVLPTEGGGGFCKASGSVIGRISDTVSVEVSRSYTEKTKVGEKLISLNLKFFKLNANIFKSYGNLPEECDIIEEISTVSLFGKCRLPLETHATYLAEYDYTDAVYSDTELVKIATARLNSATATRLTMATLVKIKTNGEFTDRGYLMSNDITFTAEVGTDVSFSAE